MKDLKVEVLKDKMIGILSELGNAIDGDDINISSMSIGHSQVEIVLSAPLEEFEQELLKKNLSNYSGSYGRVWFTTRFDGDSQMNFHIDLV